MFWHRTYGHVMYVNFKFRIIKGTKTRSNIKVASLVSSKLAIKVEMFKIVCLILVFFAIQTYTLKCYECGKKNVTETRGLFDDALVGNCKDKNDNGDLIKCQKEEICVFAFNRKDGCRFEI